MLMISMQVHCIRLHFVQIASEKEEKCAIMDTVKQKGR